MGIFSVHGDRNLAPPSGRIIAFYKALEVWSTLSVTGPPAAAKMLVLIDVYVNVKACKIAR